MEEVPKKRASPLAGVPMAAPGVVAPVVQFVPLKLPVVGVVDQASFAACNGIAVKPMPEATKASLRIDKIWREGQAFFVGFIGEQGIFWGNGLD